MVILTTCSLSTYKGTHEELYLSLHGDLRQLNNYDYDESVALISRCTAVSQTLLRGEISITTVTSRHHASKPC